MNKDQIKGKVEELKGRARQAFGTAKETLKEKKEQVHKAFDEVKDAPEQTWTTMRVGVDNGVKDLERQFEAVRSKISP